jgi:hypothetical protein
MDITNRRVNAAVQVTNDPPSSNDAPAQVPLPPPAPEAALPADYMLSSKKRRFEDAREELFKQVHVLKAKVRQLELEKEQFLNTIKKLDHELHVVGRVVNVLNSVDKIHPRPLSYRAS